MGAPRRWGAAVGPGAGGGPCPGHSREGTRGSGTGGQKGQCFAAARKSSKSQSAFIVYSALALSLFTHKNKLASITITKLELNFFSGKP